MILNHIAQRTCMFVISCTILYPERLRRRDLDLIDIVRVPKWRENRVCEAQDKDVLRGFFAEKMVDPIRLFFTEGIVDDAIELSRRGEIGPERFFHDYASPASFTGLVQAGGFQMLENRLKLIGRQRQNKRGDCRGCRGFYRFHRGV